MLFAKLYWKQISFAVACLIIIVYISLLKHQINALKRDNDSLNARIAIISALGKQQTEKSDRIEEGGRKAAKIVTEQYLTDLEKVKKYYAHRATKPVIDSVCQSTSDSASQMPSTDSSPTRTDAGTADQVPSGRSLESQCAETTIMLLKLQEFEITQQSIK